jgi:hypothetical protein
MAFAEKSGSASGKIAAERVQRRGRSGPAIHAPGERVH